LKNDVVPGVAFVELVLDFFQKIVFFVLGFPVAVRQVVQIDEGAVHDDRRLGALDAVLGDQRQLWRGSLAALC
jgi:hypothetical protein